MIYKGSKRAIARHIIPIITANRTPNQTVIDMFTGGGNILAHFDPPKYGVDSNPYVISALTMIRDRLDEIPKNNTEFTEDDYDQLKEIGTLDSQLYGYVGFALSHSGRWYGGWRRDRTGKRDYVAEAYRNAVKQSPGLQGAGLYPYDYREISGYIPSDAPCIIYCDPPYAGTEGYSNDAFNHDAFWEWCVDMTQFHQVFVSEYNAPDGFVCVWQQERKVNITNQSRSAVEKLFVHRTQT